MKLRPLHEADATALLAVQALAYPPSHHESWAVLGRRLQLWPQGCWGAEGDAGLCAYVISHPWQQGRPVPLHGVLESLPARPDAYHLHDLALHPDARGRGVAAQLVEAVLRQAAAAGLDTLTLVAVQGSRPFWERMGFRASPAALPAAYGADALAMRRRLGA